MSDSLIQSEPVSRWPFNISSPILVAGPCGVESERQIMLTARGLRSAGVSILRGGIWKPRTRPESFQGIGSAGLKWLKQAGIENNLPVAVEVAHPRHIHEALAAGIDVLWIGARTTVNPFLVQEIADALNGVNIPVMVKNPVNPDLSLWIGAFERLNRAGIHMLMAVHRGFSSYEKSVYRNPPNWQIPIELRRRFPELPLICDPSHICGDRSMIATLAQTAMDLNYDGLMIETHHDPENALSDKEQQLTPSKLGELMSGLIIRQTSVDDIVFKTMLEELRAQIDKTDEQILTLAAERMGIARMIGQYKKENNMTILQVERWNEILKTRTSSGKRKDLDATFIQKLYELIHEESIRQQTDVMNAAVLNAGKESDQHLR